jgi:hypothetical protein
MKSQPYKSDIMMFNFNMFAFSDVPQKSITREKILKFIEDKSTKRINFATTHASALKQNENNVGGKITLPFTDTIEPIIKQKLSTKLFTSNFGGIWKALNTEKEYEQFKNFVSEYNEIVFLRDLLDLSLTLSMNFDDEETHTEIGELEVKAKFDHVEEAESKLVEICKSWIRELPYYKNVDYICAMPDSDTTKKGLPHRIVEKITGFKFQDISDKVFWTSKKDSAKDAKSVLNKLEIAESSGLQISSDVDLKGKTILLFDDLYMSGVTMQYVAMKLKEAGASRVFGMCIVKSRGNTAR